MAALAAELFEPHCFTAGPKEARGRILPKPNRMFITEQRVKCSNFEEVPF